MCDLGPQVALLSPGALFSSSNLRKQKEIYALIKSPAPGCGHWTSVHDPLARTSHMTTPSCTESWEMQSLAEKPLLCPPQHCWYCRLGESLWRGFPVHSRMSGNILGFFLLHAGNSAHGKQSYLQTLSNVFWEQNYPLVENCWSITEKENSGKQLANSVRERKFKLMAQFLVSTRQWVPQGRGELPLLLDFVCCRIPTLIPCTQSNTWPIEGTQYIAIN